MALLHASYYIDVFKITLNLWLRW